MTDRELEGRVRSAMEHAAPDKLDAILSFCDEQKGTVIPMTSKKKNRWAVPLAAAAALVLLCGGAAGIQTWQAARTVDSVVMLDVNPSLSISVNAREKVLSVDPLNEDARVVLGDMDLEGAGLDVAVNALIGSMLRSGYLSDLQNSILVSVENDDGDRSAALQAKVADSISQALSGDSLSGAVLSQTLSPADAELTQLAAQYGISLGKAALIQEVTAQDPTLTFAGLAPMSVNEIALIASSKNLTTPSVSQTGSASDKAYIGRDAALAAACAHAGVALSDAAGAEVKFDCDHGLMVYEVEFYAGTSEYEYDVNALTGAVVNHKAEHHGTHSSTAGAGSAAYIGEAAAKTAALAHAGVSERDTSYLHCWMEYDDGLPECYAVEFLVGSTEYEYEIDLYTGGVCKSGYEANSSWHHEDDHDDGHHGGSVTPAAPAAYIGRDAARDAALAHAGLALSSVYDLKTELDLDDGDGPDVYDVEFKSGGLEYEYEIDARTGAVLAWEQEADD